MSDLKLFGTNEPTRDMLVAAGLMEGESYRDFPTANDCFPEDWEELDSLSAFLPERG